jgi:surfeit locus 1 family protein
MRIRLNPLPVLTLFSVAALAMLLWLGGWQFSRYQDKRLLQDVAPPTVRLEPFEVIPGGLQLVYGVSEGKPGWRVFTPVRHGEQVLFVDADYLPGVETPDWRTVQPPRALAGPAVSGAVIRPHAPGAFAARPAPERHLWYAVDLAAMGAAAGLEGVEPYYVAMPYIGPTGEAAPNPFAESARGDPLPAARHLGYALTWWGLAASLIAVYLAFHARLGRLIIR